MARKRDRDRRRSSPTSGGPDASKAPEPPPFDEGRSDAARQGDRRTDASDAARPDRGDRVDSSSTEGAESSTRRGRWIAACVLLGALLTLFALTFWRRWQILDETPFPVGIDGYFYPTHLRALLEHGELAYPDFPVAFLLMAPFAAATDPIVGAKLAAAFYGALIVLPAYGLGARLGRSRGAGLVAAALAATSAGSTYLTIEFVKNGIGMTIAVTAIWLVLRATDRSPSDRLSKSRTAIAITLVIAAFATHKLAGAFVVVVGAPAILGALADRAVLHGRRLIYAILGLVALGAVIGIAFGGHLVGDAFSSRAQLGAPALAREGKVLLSMGHEALIGAVLGWLALALLAFDRAHELARPARVVAWVTIGLSLAIAFPWLAVEDPQGLAFRLRVVAFIPMVLSAAIVAGAFHRALTGIVEPKRSAIDGGPRLRGKRAIVPDGILAVLALVVVIAMPARRIEGRIVAHPAMVAAVQAMAGDVPEGDVVIVPERHIMFMIAWYTRVPVRLSPEPVPEAKRWRAMPLAFIGMGSPLDQLLVEGRREPTIPAPIGLHPRHVNGFVLVREATWAWLLDQLPPDARAHFAAWPTI
ncbi:MAG: hypothetical protein ACKV2T_09495 [Kofleriaceae bacterium]